MIGFKFSNTFLWIGFGLRMVAALLSYLREANKALGLLIRIFLRLILRVWIALSSNLVSLKV